MWTSHLYGREDPHGFELACKSYRQRRTNNIVFHFHFLIDRSISSSMETTKRRLYAAEASSDEPLAKKPSVYKLVSLEYGAWQQR